MRVRGKINVFQPLIALLCLALSCGFLIVTSQYIVSTITWYLAAILSFSVALFISSGIGMLFEERSRFGGILLLASFVPYLYFFGDTDGVLRLDGMFPGILAGIGFMLHAFVNNRFDTVAKRTKTLLKMFFAGMMVYGAYILLIIIIAEETNEVPQYVTTGSNELFLIILSLFSMFILFEILMKMIRGIKASDVFVYGPSKSGKTILLLALYNQFVNYYGGQRTETIISSSREEDYYRIENMLAELRNGKQPKSNQKTDLALYTLKGKKFIKPIEFSFVDYGGEFTENLTPEEYLSSVLEISKQIPEIDKTVFDKNIGKHDFLKGLKEKHPDEIVYVLDHLVLAHIYKRMENAGKIIFLVDGEHIVSYHKGGDGHLLRLFGQYSRIMDLFGAGKSYAIVVTKADKIKDIADVMDNSPEARIIEKEIYELLTEIDTFKEIIHRASKVPIHFYAVSANALKCADQQEDSIRNIYPWRVEQIAQFGL